MTRDMMTCDMMVWWYDGIMIRWYAFPRAFGCTRYRRGAPGRVDPPWGGFVVALRHISREKKISTDTAVVYDIPYIYIPGIACTRYFIPGHTPCMLYLVFINNYRYVLIFFRTFSNITLLVQALSGKNARQSTREKARPAATLVRGPRATRAARNAWR